MISAVLTAPLIFKEVEHYQTVVGGPRIGTSLISRPHGFLLFLFRIAGTNLFTAAAAFAAVLVLLAALAHRLVWPGISRPIYAAHRYGVIRQHKLLVVLGSTCLLFAWPTAQ